MKTIAALSLALLAPAALAQNVLVVAQDGSGDFKEVTLSDGGWKNGKWSVLYFYPLDFTFV